MFIFFLLLLILSSNPVYSEEKDSSDSQKSVIEYGSEIFYVNKYLWRGINYNEGIIIQPNFWVKYNAFTFGLWSNITIDDINNLRRRNEIDLNLNYEYSFLNFQIDNWFMYYIYPKQDDSPSTGEFMIQIRYPFQKLNLFSNFSVDIIKYFGAYYIEPGVDYDVNLSEDLNLYLSVNCGIASKKFNETYIGTSQSTLSILSANSMITYNVYKNLYIKLNYQFNKVLDEGLFSYIGKYSNFIGLGFGME